MAKSRTSKVENQEELTQDPTLDQIEVQAQEVVTEVEENNDNISQEIESIVEEEKEVIEDTTQKTKQFTPVQNRNKVKKIIQRRPSHYSLLMEDGRQVIVHKSLFDKERMIVLQD